MESLGLIDREQLWSTYLSVCFTFTRPVSGVKVTNEQQAFVQVEIWLYSVWYWYVLVNLKVCAALKLATLRRENKYVMRD